MLPKIVEEAFVKLLIAVLDEYGILVELDPELRWIDSNSCPRLANSLGVPKVVNVLPKRFLLGLAVVLTPADIPFAAITVVIMLLFVTMDDAEMFAIFS